MSDIEKRMMLSLPEVKHLVDKAPIVTNLIKPKKVHLRFFKTARKHGMPMREQLEVLGVPWAFRKLPVQFGDRPFLKVCSRFSRKVQQEIADNALKMGAVECFRVSNAIAMLDETSQVWVVRHHNDLAEQLSPVCRYLDEHPVRSLKTSVRTVLERSEKHRTAPDSMYRFIARVHEGSVLIERERGQDVWRRVETPISRGSGGAGMIMGRRERFVISHREEISDAGLPIDMTLPYSPDGDISIRLLDTKEEFEDEGRLMNHCAATYLQKVADRECLVASVRNSAGARMATLEFGLPDLEIKQIRGHSNRPVDETQIRELACSFIEHLKEINASNDPTIRGYKPIFAGVDEAEVNTRG